MLKASSNRQCDYIQLPLPIFFYSWVQVTGKIAMLRCTQELTNKLDNFKTQLTEEQSKQFDELFQSIVTDYKHQEEIAIEHNVKVYKFLDSIKYVLSKHTGGDRKLKALRDDVKRVVSETFGDY